MPKQIFTKNPIIFQSMKIIYLVLFLKLLHQQLLFITPENIKREAIRQFPIGSPSSQSNTTLRSQDKTTCNERKVHIIQRINDKFFYQYRDPCRLEIGRYNWVMNNHYELIFGKMINNLEFGIKHFQIAQLKQVYSAGEMIVQKESIDWNLDSGTFSLDIFRRFPGYKERMIEKMVNIWKIVSCKRYIYKEKFPKKNLATKEEINLMCKNYPESNYLFIMNDTKKSLCEDHSCIIN
jgi:hypothetical protein